MGNEYWNIVEQGILDYIVEDVNDENVDETLREIEKLLKLKMFKSTVLKGKFNASKSGKHVTINTYTTMLAFNLAKENKIAMAEHIINFLQIRPVKQENLKQFVMTEIMSDIYPEYHKILEKGGLYTCEVYKDECVLVDLLNYTYMKNCDERVHSVKTQLLDAIGLLKLITYLRFQEDDVTVLKDVLTYILKNSAFKLHWDIDFAETLIRVLLLSDDKREMRDSDKKLLELIIHEYSTISKEMFRSLIDWKRLENENPLNFEELGFTYDPINKGNENLLAWGESKVCTNLREQLNAVQGRFFLEVVKAATTSGINIFKDGTEDEVSRIFNLYGKLKNDMVLDILTEPIPYLSRHKRIKTVSDIIFKVLKRINYEHRGWY